MRTRAAAVGSQWLTAWVTARPVYWFRLGLSDGPNRVGASHTFIRGLNTDPASETLCSRVLFYSGRWIKSENPVISNSFGFKRVNVPTNNISSETHLAEKPFLLHEQTLNIKHSDILRKNSKNDNFQKPRQTWIRNSVWRWYLLLRLMFNFNNDNSQTQHRVHVSNYIVEQCNIGSKVNYRQALEKIHVNTEM
jgi:hypothetical protein